MVEWTRKLRWRVSGLVWSATRSLIILCKESGQNLRKLLHQSPLEVQIGKDKSVSYGLVYSHMCMRAHTHTQNISKYRTFLCVLQCTIYHQTTSTFNNTFIIPFIRILHHNLATFARNKTALVGIIAQNPLVLIHKLDKQINSNSKDPQICFINQLRGTTFHACTLPFDHTLYS